MDEPMRTDGGTVLIAGASEDRVTRTASHLAGEVAVRTFVPTDDETRPSTDVEVAVILDRNVADDPSLDTLPDDVERVLVFEDGEYDLDRHESCESVLVEPLAPGDLRSTVTSLARRVRYDRRLRECAELATRHGRVEANGNGGVPTDFPQVPEEIADAKAELDGLVAEFSSEDFRQAFRALAAD